MITAIFDLDGTLADTLFDLADAVNYGLQKMGYPLHDYDEYRYFVGNGVQKLCYRALPDGRKDDTEKLLEFFREYYSVHCFDKSVIYDGMKDTLKRLSDNGVKLAVATNKPQNFARIIVSELLPEFKFESVLGGCDERPRKPDTAIINAILSGIPEKENRVYMVGDSAVDVNTAKNAEITSIGCIWGFRGREELQSAGADFLAEKPSDIADIILK